MSILSSLLFAGAAVLLFAVLLFVTDRRGITRHLRQIEARIKRDREAVNAAGNDEYAVWRVSIAERVYNQAKEMVGALHWYNLSDSTFWAKLLISKRHLSELERTLTAKSA